MKCGSRELFQPDRRNLWHQRHCSKPGCRRASKAASQRRWLGKPQNRDYFHGPAHVERVRGWRAAHPRYWHRSGRQSCPALQEVFAAQPLVLIGLIANLTGSALQEDIAQHSRRLLRLGQDILGGTLPQEGGHHGRQTSAMPRAGP